MRKLKKDYGIDAYVINTLCMHHDHKVPGISEGKHNVQSCILQSMSNCRNDTFLWVQKPYSIYF